MFYLIFYKWWMFWTGQFIKNVANADAGCFILSLCKIKLQRPAWSTTVNTGSAFIAHWLKVTSHGEDHPVILECLHRLYHEKQTQVVTLFCDRKMIFKVMEYLYHVYRKSLLVHLCFTAFSRCFCPKQLTIIHTYIHALLTVAARYKVLTSTSGAVWGSVSRSRKLQHADQRNRTSDLAITRRWLYL